MHYSSNVKKKKKLLLLFYVVFTLVRIFKYFIFFFFFSFFSSFAISTVAPLSSLFTSPLFVSGTQIFPLPLPRLTHLPSTDLVDLSSPFLFFSFFSFFLHLTIPDLFSLKHLYLNSITIKIQTQITILKLIKLERLKK